MIHCNLAVLLAERRLRISGVAAETGISRTTLTALCNNNCQGIQMNTLNTLCYYLDITPSQLLSFVPVEIAPARVEGNTNRIDVFFSIRTRQVARMCELDGFLEIVVNNKSISAITVDFSRGEPKKDSEYNKYNNDGIDLLMNTMRAIPTPFVRDIELALYRKLLNGVLSEVPLDSRKKLTYKVIWPHQDKFGIEEKLRAGLSSLSQIGFGKKGR